MSQSSPLPFPAQGPTGDPGIDGLQEPLRSIALQIVAESGGRVTIGSGWRSNAQQSSLYNRWVSGEYDVPAVARPGTSHHETGLAVDFGGDLRLAQELGHRYGLVFPVRGEAWHAELGEGIPSQGGGGFQGEPNFADEFGVQYNLNYTGTGQAAKPQDVLANRMASIAHIMGMDATSGAVGTGTSVDPNLINPFAMGNPGANPLEASLPEAGARSTSPLAQQQPSGTRVPTINYDSQSGQASYGTVDPSQFGAYAYSRFSQFGWGAEDYGALVELWNKESGDPAAGSSRVTWNPNAQNPTSTAYGIGQFLNGTWAGTGIQKTSNPQRQIDAGMMYIASRFGNPRNALAFHRRNNWY
jgi:hypothetical protein